MRIIIRKTIFSYFYKELKANVWENILKNKGKQDVLTINSDFSFEWYNMDLRISHGKRK